MFQNTPVILLSSIQVQSNATRNICSHVSRHADHALEPLVHPIMLSRTTNVPRPTTISKVTSLYLYLITGIVPAAGYKYAFVIDDQFLLINRN